MCLIKAKDKSKHLSERSSTMSKATKTEFCWTDDEIQLILESVNQYRCNREYEGTNWENVRFKYERIQEIFIESYPKNSVEGKEFPVLENPEVIGKDRVAAKLKKCDRIIRKLQTPKGKLVQVVLCLCSMISEKLFGGGSSCVASLQEGIDSSSQADQENVDCVLNGPYDQLGSSSSSSNYFSNSSNVADDLDDEDQILQQNQSKSERRENVIDLLNKRKDLKLAAKNRPEKRKLNYAEEDIQLKRKLIERMDRSDQEFQENLERINRTMENIGHSVQQSVGLLAQILRSRTQPNFYCNSNMFPSLRGFHYQNRQVQNININNEIVPKNSSNTFN